MRQRNNFNSFKCSKKMKLKLSKKRKKQIKKNFDLSKPPKRVNELRYFNLIKAGKIRSQNSFKSKKGKYITYPEKFTNDFLLPLSIKKGITVKELLKNKDYAGQIKELFKSERLDYFFNENTFLKFLINLPDYTYIYIYTGKYKVKANKTEIQLYIKKVAYALQNKQKRILFFKVSLTDGFNFCYYWLPDVNLINSLR